jgi:hypothetical protein
VVYRQASTTGVFGMKKLLIGFIAGVSILIAGCSSNPDAESIETISVQESVAPMIQTNLEITQEWNENSVTLSLFDSEGNNCAVDIRKVGSECYGFYIGWSANFSDEDRVVDYSVVETITISEFQVGDSGNFQLMYQNPEDQNSPVSVVKEFPFTFSG